jgi:hypothetical protein
MSDKLINRCAANLGRAGGKARARALTDEQREEIARMGGQARAEAKSLQQQADELMKRLANPKQ